jgi:CubicO group peptidase (beta-lactamase class C family)
LQEAVDRGDPVGVVALVISGDRVVYHEAFGKQDVGRGVPMAPGSIFCVASMTKPITSVAAMMLVDEGKLGSMTRSTIILVGQITGIL